MKYKVKFYICLKCISQGYLRCIGHETNRSHKGDFNVKRRCKND